MSSTFAARRGREAPRGHKRAVPARCVRPTRRGLRRVCGLHAAAVALRYDSFEKAVINETEEARLVLIVDLWHPELETGRAAFRRAQRRGAARASYRGVALRGEYETTSLRGH